MNWIKIVIITFGGLFWIVIDLFMLVIRLLSGLSEKLDYSTLIICYNIFGSIANQFTINCGKDFETFCDWNWCDIVYWIAIVIKWTIGTKFIATGTK